MRRKIIKHKVDSFVCRIHGSHPFQGLEDFHPSFTGVEVSPEFIMAQIVERQILSCPKRSYIGCRQSRRRFLNAPSSPMYRSDLDWTEFIIANDMGVLKNVFIELVYAFFLRRTQDRSILSRFWFAVTKIFVLSGSFVASRY